MNTDSVDPVEVRIHGCFSLSRLVEVHLNDQLTNTRCTSQTQVDMTYIVHRPYIYTQILQMSDIVRVSRIVTVCHKNSYCGL